ncbi:PAS domain-containing protein [Streptomyces albipurpureus]|uniref:PAS domain-containing protein n=1 Tax=Streptomyces albipurpureus TaxID=2897419 RepID=A0ABT0UVL8_9ACTN|nr:PAS domain-containing protein [Streptomyces sp. CWNU-1]MCM2391403.1 PAS domain-containing protein [Streptomyces sp. CWNU-1]
MSSRPSRGAARLAAILDALPDGLVLVNCNGTVVNANTIALELFETPGTALVGRGLLDLLPAFDSRLIPGSMRRPEAADERGRTKPTRMVARRTDGSEFPVEVTSASLEDGRKAYDTYSGGFTGDELLMLVLRDLSGTVDTEAELARSQRQTEMILRAAAEGVVGTDTDGRVVLVNPAAAQILGFRASDLGGQELHPLILHSREDGKPFPYAESPLADTLKSGRKHRVRGQVLWAKNGARVPVDLTTAPVRDGDQLVGAVMTFTDRRPYEELEKSHAEELDSTIERLNKELAETTERLTAELADKAERYTSEIERRDERYLELGASHEQLTAVLGGSLRGPLEELRSELGTLAADPAGQLWPEANQILHHLAAGYARMTTLIDNVLGFQRLDTGVEQLYKAKAQLDAVVAAGVEGAVELIGPGRVQFAVHAPPIEVEVDGGRLATALAHLVADVAGVDSTGKTRLLPDGGYVDSTIVVAAAQRGEVVRIEVRGPFTGGDPVHQPIVRGIVQAHGGVLQTHEVPGTSGSAYVLEVPLGEGAGVVPLAPAPDVVAPVDGGTAGDGIVLPEQLGSPETLGGGRRRARRGSTDAFLESPVASQSTGESPPTPPTGRRRAHTDELQPGGGGQDLIPAQDSGGTGGARAGVADGRSGTQGDGTGRRRGRPSPTDSPVAVTAGTGKPTEGSVVTAAEGAAATGRPARGQTVPPQGVPVDPQGLGQRGHQGVMHELPAGSQLPARQLPSAADAQASGRRARRALAPAPAETGGASAQEAGRSAFALPPAQADRVPPRTGQADTSPAAQHDLVRAEPGADHTPPQQHPLPTGRRRAADLTQPQGWDERGTAGAGSAAVSADDATGQHMATSDEAAPGEGPRAGSESGQDAGSLALPMPNFAALRGASSGAGNDPMGAPRSGSQHAGHTHSAGSQPTPQSTGSQHVAPHSPGPKSIAQPLPAEAPLPADASQGRAFSVRTLGQGAPLAQQIADAEQQQSEAKAHSDKQGGQASGSGRRRKLGTPSEGERPEASARPHPQLQPPIPAQPGARRPIERSEGRAYAIGAPDEGAEGPEPLDGPGGAIEVANRPHPQPVDDELPPEPLDNPRRLLVWPAPDVSTQQALSERGYRPVVVHSREEVDAQIAAFPAALFVDPLTGPITRTALQSLRQAAVAAEVPVLVTAGLGQATREAAYGADPAILLKALAPRDSEQHPPRVLLIEEHEEIALALTATLERRGMQVARAGADTDAVMLASQTRPNLVVMDLMQIRRRRAGIIDWLRANGQLNRTPLVVYTSAGLNRADLPRLSSGETVLFLAERSTSSEVQARIVDLLAKIGTN